jgi:hypothetical protein
MFHALYFVMSQVETYVLGSLWPMNTFREKTRKRKGLWYTLCDRSYIIIFIGCRRLTGSNE